MIQSMKLVKKSKKSYISQLIITICHETSTYNWKNTTFRPSRKIRIAFFRSSSQDKSNGLPSIKSMVHHQKNRKSVMRARLFFFCAIQFQRIREISKKQGQDRSLALAN